METKTEEPISKDDPLSSIQFSNIFNLEEIQHLQDLFADVNGVASIITTPDGRPITKPSNFTRLCNNIIRKTEKGLLNCYKSDAEIGKQNPFGPIVRPCMSCGLWDAGASITVEGKHIANWLIGQVRNNNDSEQTMIQYADEIGANRTDFLKALHEVPVMSSERFNNIAKLLFAFANELSEKAYNNLLLKIQIAEKEKAIELVKESEERFQLLFNKAPLSYQSLDINGHFIEVNQHWLDMFGYAHEDVIGKWFGDFLVPGSKEAYLKQSPIFIAKGEIHSEFEMVHKNGNLLFIAFDGKIGHDLNGKFKQTHSILQDITERKLTEHALKESELKYRGLVENSPDAIVIYAKGRIVMVNKEGLHLMAATRKEELIGRPVIQFVHPDYRDFVKGRMKELKNDGVVLPLSEEKLLRLDGSEVEVDVKAMSVILDNKPAVQMIIRDITERKRVEAEILSKTEELQKVNAEKDKFFSIIAHDLRSPLCGFMGLTEILAENSLKIPTEELHKLALAMKNSATNVFRLLGNLLEWSRMQRGLTVFTPELLLLNSVISESLIPITEDAIKKDIRIIFEIPDDIFVLADKNMLESIIRNLVSNAIKFTSNGGKIIVSAQLSSEKMVNISIMDTGIGMNKEMIANLFRLDANTNRKGTDGEYSTGLGLIISKDLIEKNGGELLIESEEGKGSLFKLTLSGIHKKEKIKVA
ncbi:MAG TPA: PocR ligand-binding domain-containing protein [Paludibacter sp.]